MHAPPIRVSWAINVPTMLTAIGMVCGGAWWAANIAQRVDQIEAFRVERTRATDQNFSDIRGELRTLGNIPYRVTVVEQKVEATNVRIDRLAETIITSIDNLRKEVGNLSTRVEVLSQKIDTITPPRLRPTTAEIQ